jgi:uncharacterized surface protein with fasciclin (FAS1) repeats
LSFAVSSASQQSFLHTPDSSFLIKPITMHVSAVLGFAALASAQSLTSLLTGTSDLSSLLGLLQAHPNILSTLANATNITIFAPNNAAISTLTSASNFAALNASGPNFIGNTLRYHVLANRTVQASAIGSTPLFPNTLLTNGNYTNVTNGQVVRVRNNGTAINLTTGLKNQAQVVSSVNFTGGVVHIINSVLTIPPNISTTASAAGLSALAGALGLTNLSTTLSTLRDVTVFAPTNSAFANIGSALGTLSASQVAQILQYHVINGTIAYSASLGNTSIPTLGGGRVNITVLPSGVVYVNQARVVNADALVANGVLHQIDSVLNPNSTATPQFNATGAVIAYSGASSASNLGALTSTLRAPTTTATALTATNSAVASGYTGSPRPAGGAAASSSSAGPTSTGAAMPMATAAIGAVALGGWVALMGQM